MKNKKYKRTVSVLTWSAIEPGAGGNAAGDHNNLTGKADKIAPTRNTTGGWFRPRLADDEKPSPGRALEERRSAPKKRNAGGRTYISARKKNGKIDQLERNQTNDEDNDDDVAG